ncbi:MAG: AIPR family protein [Candidatus Acidiferrum sp.]
MQIETLKKCTDWFKVHSFRDLEDPSGRVARKEIVVALDQYPHDFGLGPNPREPNLTSEVSRAIRDTLEDDWKDFHLLNRGVTVVAKDIDFDNRSQRVRFVLDETEDEKKFFGLLDGGNTNARINVWREALDEQQAAARMAETYLNMQVLIPQTKGASVPAGEMLDLLNDIKEARNTSVQVKKKSLADARNHFEALKLALQKEAYFPQISWHEGQNGGIDAQQIVALLMIYFPSFCSAAEGGEPSNAYGHKERCLDAFLEYAKNEPQELERWIKILPTLIELFDTIQLQFPDYYPGYFGKIAEVQIYSEKKYERGNKKYRKTAPTSQFLSREMKYSYPAGWIYPLFAAFRFLAGPDKSTGEVTWKKDPIQFWQKHSKTICDQYVPHIVSKDYAPKKIATDPLCYQAVRRAVTDLYKDELLRDAGISA